ncbi:MAG: hypothetical protein JNN29_06145 [Chitinophagaceae bacterium]|nr:hypothetical protein [Chitinophagaceae bacterium]
MDKQHSSGIKEEANHLLKSGRSYLETWVELNVMRFVRLSSRWVAHWMVKGILVVLVLFLILFIGLALAFWIGDKLDNRYLGFGLVGLGFGLLVPVVILLGKWILIPLFRDRFIQQFFEDEQTDQTLP